MLFLRPLHTGPSMFAKATFAALASLIALAAVSGPALADHRKKHRRMAYDTYYSGPEVVKGIPGIRVLFGDYGLSEEEYDALYGSGEDGQPNFDESYYEPKANTAPTSKTKPITKTVTKTKPATKPPVTKEETATVKTQTPLVKTATAAPDDEVQAKPAKPETPSTGSVSCDKASGIVSDYGFTSVKPSSCTGSIYAFNATRGGKSFAIKLDPKSGELTEVKKLE